MSHRTQQKVKVSLKFNQINSINLLPNAAVGKTPLGGHFSFHFFIKRFYLLPVSTKFFSVITAFFAFHTLEIDNLPCESEYIQVKSMKFKNKFSL